MVEISDLKSTKPRFSTDEVSTIIQRIVVNIIGRSIYQDSMVSEWATKIVDCCLNELSSLKKAYKYAVTCTIVEKKNAGFHSSATCLWDPSTDGSCTVRWENKSLYCFVSVYGFYIQ